MLKEEALRSYIYVIYCFVEGTSRAKLCEEETDPVWVPAKTYTSTGNSFTVKMMSDICGGTKRFFVILYSNRYVLRIVRGCRGSVRMVVGFTTTCAINAYHHSCCEFESRYGRGVQHYVIKLVSDLRQVVAFLRVVRLTSRIKLTATITEILGLVLLLWC